MPLLAVPRGTVMAAFAANSVGRPALEGGERTVSPLNRVGMITDRYRISAEHLLSTAILQGCNALEHLLGKNA